MVLSNFLIELRGTGAAGHTSRRKNIIKVGINITFHMVIRVASRFQFLAGLVAKLSIVPPLEISFAAHLLEISSRWSGG